MQTNSRRLIGAASAALVLLSAGTARAQGKGHGKEKEEHGNGKAHLEQSDGRYERDRTTQYPADPRYDPRNAPRTDPRYDPSVDPRYSRNSRRVPPGLAKKPGGMPPGQYKKQYGANEGAGVLRDVLGRRGYPVTRIVDAGQSEYVYYRQPDGSIRRAVVSPGGDRLRFSNVPTSLINEVLARLY